MTAGRVHTEITAVGGGPLRGILHHEASYAVLEQRGIEIEQQADVIAAHAEIGQKLCFMDRQQFIDGLDLEDKFPLNDDIGAEASIHCNFFIDDGYIDLPLKCDARPLEFVAETFLINGFQQSRTHTPVKLDRQPDDCLGQFSAQQHGLTQSPSVCLAVLREKP